MGRITLIALIKALKTIRITSLIRWGLFSLLPMMFLSCGSKKNFEVRVEATSKNSEVEGLKNCTVSKSHNEYLLATGLNWGPKLLSEPIDIEKNNTFKKDENSSIILPLPTKDSFLKGMIKDPAKTNATSLNSEKIFKRIYNRTFATAFLDGCLMLKKEFEKYKNSSAYLTKKVLEPSYKLTSGKNIWLLDFAHDKTNNRYKLFFATDLSTADKLKEYGVFQPSTNSYKSNRNSHNTLLNFWIGKGLKEPNFSASKSNVNPVFYSRSGVSYDLTKDLKEPKKSQIEPWREIIGKPKIIFASVDFLESPATHFIFRFLWLQDYYNAFNSYELELRDKNLKEKKEEIFIPPVEIDTSFLPYEYKDFAVIEIDYNENVLNRVYSSETNPKTKIELTRLKTWIEQATNEVLREKRENERFNFKNKDNFSSNWWDRLDPTSLIIYSKNGIKDLDYDRRLYYAGYSVSELRSKNNEKVGMPIWENHIMNYKDNASSKEEKYILTDLGLTDYTIDFMDVFAHRYGIGGYVLRNDDKRENTVTGALILNKEAQPIGIMSDRLFYGSYFNKVSGNVRVFDAFQQYENVFSLYNILDFFYTGAPLLDRKYLLNFNLIDYSKMSKTDQKNSYRIALNDLYPNGPFDDGNLRTTLFDNYKL